MTHIVIIGALTGFKLATTLASAFAKNSDVKLTIIEKQKELFWGLSATRSMVRHDFAQSSFLSLDNVFPASSPHKIVHGNVTRLTKTSAVLESGEEIQFDYLVIATGINYGLPIRVTESSKDSSLTQLKHHADAIQAAKEIVLVGAGPVGCEVAGEIKDLYPEKKLTIVTSSADVLPNDAACNDRSRQTIKDKLCAAGVTFLFNEKIFKDDNKSVWEGQHTVKTESGKSISSDYTLFCWGRGKPNAGFVSSLGADLLNEKGEVKIKKTHQLDHSDFGHIFAMGDVAATQAPKTFMCAMGQIEAVAKNIQASLSGKALIEHTASAPPMMAVVLNSNTAVGQVPWMPGFVADYLVKSFKAKHLLLNRMKGEYNSK